MKNLTLLVITIFFIISCDRKANSKDQETIIKGKVSILVDETLLPIIESQVEVFQSQYNATITLVPKSETEIALLLSEDKNRLAIMSRELTTSEAAIFTNLKIKPKITTFGTDAIAFISSKKNADSIINLEKFISFIQGKNQESFSGFVFDNANSSTVRYIKNLAKVNQLPKEKIYSLNTNNEVIEYVSKNPNSIGIVGVNWLSDPMQENINMVNLVQVLAVQSKDNSLSKPSQDNIASGSYPLTREIKMLNYQGSSGLGMGFASFVGGDIGQRIILKSGLVPIRIPGRNIKIRSKI